MIQRDANGVLKHLCPSEYLQNLQEVPQGAGLTESQRLSQVKFMLRLR